MQTSYVAKVTNIKRDTQNFCIQKAENQTRQIILQHEQCIFRLSILHTPLFFITFANNCAHAHQYHPFIPPMNNHKPSKMPKIVLAIIDPNALTRLGLRNLLEDIIPMADIQVFDSFDELEIDTDIIVHYSSHPKYTLRTPLSFARIPRRQLCW